jgi:DNA-binding IclR family transcriptional regulator
LHCTASGKLFLATMAEAEREALLARLTLPRMTPNTITTAQGLRTECEAIAARGYATDREEFIAGLVAAAVPVRDAQGATRAALAVHGPSARLSMERAVAALPALRAAAERMTGLL